MYFILHWADRGRGTVSKNFAYGKELLERGEGGGGHLVIQSAINDA